MAVAVLLASLPQPLEAQIFVPLRLDHWAVLACLVEQALLEQAILVLDQSLMVFSFLRKRQNATFWRRGR